MRAPRPRPIRLAFALAVPVLAAAVPATAQQPPACRPETAGIVTCMVGRMCVCGLERPGRMTGTPGGWRWDCGILRPSCGGGPDTPATTGDQPPTLAPALGLDLTLPAPRPRPPRPHPEGRRRRPVDCRRARRGA
jgi:hypothetical protein